MHTKSHHQSNSGTCVFRGEAGDCLTAELWGSLHGLKLAWDLGFRKVILEVDSSDAVELMKQPTPATHEDRCLIEEIKGMLAREWCVEIQLISRWANEAADQLAEAGLYAMPGFQVLSLADEGLHRVLMRDAG
ncbi:hypothetical protein QN277_001868 [Acacia crassicarpa]|uniref:RNase H type-1 domain-containing protein n=1 Tax=Acacia crassicarpa TaxID=499986 RepID=A0AAE1THH1_9FABA|nr:hypothetical protein QN277_001868 [Acacia crassicarpa]